MALSVDTMKLHKALVAERSLTLSIIDPSKIRTVPWRAGDHPGEPRPADEERIDEQCVRVSGTDVNEYRIHTLACTGQNPFTLAFRFHQVTVAYPDGRGCGRPGCTH